MSLSDGQVSEQDLVIAAIGLKPNVQLAQAAGLSVGQGIQVDAGLRSSDPHIYALGDCALMAGDPEALAATGDHFTPPLCGPTPPGDFARLLAGVVTSGGGHLDHLTIQQSINGGRVPH